MVRGGGGGERILRLRGGGVGRVSVVASSAAESPPLDEAYEDDSSFDVADGDRRSLNDWTTYVCGRSVVWVSTGSDLSSKLTA